jgi:hemolysin activation/secretion protein
MAVRSKRFGRALAVAALLYFPVGLEAQIPENINPGAVQQHSSETNQYYKLQKQLDRNGRPASPAAVLKNEVQSNAPALPQSSSQTLLLKRVDIASSAILSVSELAAITHRYEGRGVTIKDLAAMIQQINDLYQKKGYIAARAVLPPQKVSAGIIKVQLIEARIGKIVVENNQHTKASYFADRIALKPGELVRVHDLEKSLAYLNATSNVKVRAVLEPGEQFGTTDLHLKVQPIPDDSTSLSFDNAGQAAIGRERLGFTETYGNLFGYRDPLNIGTYWADGLAGGFVSYSFPISDSGLRLGPIFSYDAIRVRASKLQKLAVNGSFYDASFRLSRPVIANSHFTFSAYVAPHFQESALQSKDVPISRIEVRSLESGGTVQAIGKRGVWQADVSLMAGDDNAAGRNFFSKYDGSVTRMQVIKGGIIAIFRGQGQAKAGNPTPLPPSEQIQIGGLSTVRGYPESELIGDNGYAISAEVDTPIPLGRMKFLGMPLGERFKSAWFVDHGAIIEGPHTTFLTGAGGGLIVNLSKYFQARANLATPLQNRATFNRTAFEFYVQSTPPIQRLFEMFRSKAE